MIREADIKTEPAKRDSTAPMVISLEGQEIPPRQRIDMQPLTDALVAAISAAINERVISASKTYSFLLEVDGYPGLKTIARNPSSPKKERLIAKLIVDTCKSFPDLEPHAGNAVADARTRILLGHRAPTGFENPHTDSHKPTNGSKNPILDGIKNASMRVIKLFNS